MRTKKKASNIQITRHLAHHGFEILVDPDAYGDGFMVARAEEHTSRPIVTELDIEAVFERYCPGSSCPYY